MLPLAGPRDGETDITLGSTNVKSNMLCVNCCPFRLSRSGTVPAETEPGAWQCTLPSPRRDAGTVVCQRGRVHQLVILGRQSEVDRPLADTVCVCDGYMRSHGGLEPRGRYSVCVTVTCGHTGAARPLQCVCDGHMRSHRGLEPRGRYSIEAAEIGGGKGGIARQGDRGEIGARDSDKRTERATACRTRVARQLVAERRRATAGGRGKL